jgi:hypothetical protein
MPDNLSELEVLLSNGCDSAFGAAYVVLASW